MKIALRSLICSICAISIMADTTSVDSLSHGQSFDSSTSSVTYEKPNLISPSDTLFTDTPLKDIQKTNPIMSMGLSALLPGAGQFYCKKGFRGLLYTTSEVVWGLVIANRVYNYNNFSKVNVSRFSDTMNLYRDSLQTYLSPETFERHFTKLVSAKMDLDLAEYRKQRDLYIIHHCIGWSAGVYLWNIADALSSSNHFHDDEPRDPKLALSLSAIPFLGLGQIYNGSFSKAGLVFTFQSMLGYMAFNNHRLMNECIKKRNQVKNTLSIPKATRESYESFWSSEYDNAFSKRNSYLWYMIIFWFYGMFDATVDAHLHDYREKIRLKPGVDVSDKSLGVSLNISF